MQIEDIGSAAHSPGLRRRSKEQRALRVLVAEDDTDTRQALAQELREDGYLIFEARDGAEMLEVLSAALVRGEPVDAILSDIRMPGLDGLHALESLRRDENRTPVILMTAFGDRATHEEARRKGAVAVFQKPYDLDDLRTVLLNVTAR